MTSVQFHSKSTLWNGPAFTHLSRWARSQDLLAPLAGHIGVTLQCLPCVKCGIRAEGGGQSPIHKHHEIAAFRNFHRLPITSAITIKIFRVVDNPNTYVLSIRVMRPRQEGHYLLLWCANGKVFSA